MFTANSMNCLAEVVGMALPGNGTIPAPYSERLRYAKSAGVKVMEVLAADLRPRDILTDAAVGNALAADASLGCSTNTVLHLAAIATEAGLDFPLERINEVAARVPHLCLLAPAGPHHMEDLYFAGGIQAVMKRLIDAGLMDGTARSVAGGTVAEAVADARVQDDEVIRPLSRPYHATGGLAVLFGNLAPSGAVVKEGAVADEMLRHSGPAQVFESEADAVTAIAAGAIVAGSVIVIRNEGPKGAPGMPEMLVGHLHAGRPGPRQRRGADHRRTLQRRHARRRHRPRRPRGAGRRTHRTGRRRRHHRRRHPRPQAHPGRRGGGTRAASRRQGRRAAASRAHGLARPLRQTRLRCGEGGSPSMTSQTKMKGAQAIVASLEAEGCDILFGFPGGVVIPLYDALYDAVKLRHILVRHEQGAVHAADGYARATGKVGVCLATSGPGATNLITGIANAYLDSIPLVAITGQVRADLIGTDAFQEADVTGITLPIVKHSYLVQNAAEIPRIIHEAFHIASTGRPGPVVIDVPVTALLGELTYKAPDSLDLAGYKPTVKGHVKQIRAAARAILEAERPVLYVGGGVISAGAFDELAAVAELVQAPVTTTLMGLGAFDERLPLSLGMLGMHGTVPANYAVHECDVLVGIGVRFDDRVTGKLSAFAPQARTIIHIDVDPAEIGKNVEPSIPIVGDARHVLAALLDELRASTVTPGRTAAWLARIAAWQDEFKLRYEPPAGEGMVAPQFVIEEIERVTAATPSS